MGFFSPIDFQLMGANYRSYNWKKRLFIISHTHTLNSNSQIMLQKQALTTESSRICLPPHSCRRQSSASSVEDGRSGRSNTTSCAPGCLWSPLSYKGEHGNHPLYPHPPPLQTTETQTERAQTSYHHFSHMHWIINKSMTEDSCYLSNMTGKLFGVDTCTPTVLMCVYLWGRLQGP